MTDIKHWLREIHDANDLPNVIRRIQQQARDEAIDEVAQFMRDRGYAIYARQILEMREKNQ